MISAVSRWLVSASVGVVTDVQRTIGIITFTVSLVRWLSDETNIAASLADLDTNLRSITSDNAGEHTESNPASTT